MRSHNKKLLSKASKKLGGDNKKVNVKKFLIYALPKFN